MTQSKAALPGTEKRSTFQTGHSFFVHIRYHLIIKAIAEYCCLPSLDPRLPDASMKVKVITQSTHPCYSQFG